MDVEAFEELLGLAGDALMDVRDIDALTDTADAILLRNRLGLSGGVVGVLGPIELARLCDALGQRLGGGRRQGIEFIEALRDLVRAYRRGDLQRSEHLIERIEASLPKLLGS